MGFVSLDANFLTDKEADSKISLFEDRLILINKEGIHSSKIQGFDTALSY